MNRRFPWYLLACSLLTLLLGAYLGRHKPQDEADSYTPMAKNILAGEGLKQASDYYGPSYSYMPPAMGILKAAFMKAFHHYNQALLIFFIGMSALTRVAFYYLARRLLPAPVALVAAAVWIFYPPGWFWGTRINPHTYTTNFLVFALLLLFIAWERKSYPLAWLGGLLWATMGLMRGEYVWAAFVAGGVTLFAFQRRKDGLKFAMIILLGWATVMLPWVVRNYRVHGRYLLTCTYSSLVLWMSIHPDYQFTGDALPLTKDLQDRLDREPNEVGKMDIVARDVVKRIKENPRILVRTMVGNFFNFWRPWLSPKVVSWKENAVFVVSYLPLFILFLIGLFKAPFRDVHWMAVGSLLLYRFLIHLPTYTIVRFRETVMPLIILIAAYSLVNIMAGKGRTSSLP